MANIMRLGGGSGGGTKYVWNKYALLIPSEYTPVEYLEGTGTQYIDTGFKPNSNSRVVCDFQALSTTPASFVFGSLDAWQKNMFGFYLAAGGANLQDLYATNAGPITGNGLTRNVVDKNKNVTTLGSVVKTNTAATFQCAYNLALFAEIITGNADAFAHARIYSCQVYDNDTLVRDFVPCVSASGVAGMYDIVNGVFYPNAGTGEFVVGEKYTGEEYLDIVVGEFVGFVDSTRIGAYPFGGIQDGYYYEAIGEEIAITENGSYDVRPYAIATVDVVSAPVLLWTNASPTSDFVAQTISVDGADYDGYLVEIHWSRADGAHKGVAYVPIGTAKATVAAHNNESGTLNTAAFRAVESATKNSISFGIGASGPGRLENNYYAIPTRIWGVKFTL